MNDKGNNNIKKAKSKKKYTNFSVLIIGQIK